jgi:hypothetical protein
MLVTRPWSHVPNNVLSIWPSDQNVRDVTRPCVRGDCTYFSEFIRANMKLYELRNGRGLRSSVCQPNLSRFFLSNSTLITLQTYPKAKNPLNITYLTFTTPP